MELPLEKTTAYDVVQVQVPMFFSLHVLVKVCPGVMIVSSGMVTSVMKSITLQFDVGDGKGGAEVGGALVSVNMTIGVTVRVGVTSPKGVLVGRSACMVCAAAVRLASSADCLEGKLHAVRNIIKMISNEKRRVFLLMSLSSPWVATSSKNPYTFCGKLAWQAHQNVDRSTK